MVSTDGAHPAPNLFEGLCIETHERIALCAVTDFDWVATDFAIFDIDLAANRKVQNHRNPFPTIRTVKEVFHWKSMLLHRYCADLLQQSQQIGLPMSQQAPASGRSVPEHGR